MGKLSVIIPVYNEEKTIAELLARVRAVELPYAFEKEIIIVDDGSEDGTVDFLKRLPEEKYKIYYHEQNKGKGAAIRAGLNKAEGDFIIIQDADLEYDPNDYCSLLRKAIEEDLNVVYGSRRLKQENNQYSGFCFYIGGVFLTWLTNVLYGQSLTDEPTCYKLFKTSFIKEMPLVCERFEFCPEVTALSSLKGVKIQEVPISYYPRHKKEGKKINWRDGFDALRTLIKYRL